MHKGFPIIDGELKQKGFLCRAYSRERAVVDSPRTRYSDSRERERLCHGKGACDNRQEGIPGQSFH